MKDSVEAEINTETYVTNVQAVEAVHALDRAAAVIGSGLFQLRYNNDEDHNLCLILFKGTLSTSDYAVSNSNMIAQK